MDVLNNTQTATTETQGSVKTETPIDFNQSIFEITANFSKASLESPIDIKNGGVKYIGRNCSLTFFGKKEDALLEVYPLGGRMTKTADGDYELKTDQSNWSNLVRRVLTPGTPEQILQTLDNKSIIDGFTTVKGFNFPAWYHEQVVMSGAHKGCIQFWINGTGVRQALKSGVKAFRLIFSSNWKDLGVTKGQATLKETGEQYEIITKKFVGEVLHLDWLTRAMGSFKVVDMSVYTIEEEQSQSNTFDLPNELFTVLMEGAKTAYSVCETKNKWGRALGILSFNGFLPIQSWVKRYPSSKEAIFSFIQHLLLNGHEDVPAFVGTAKALHLNGQGFSPKAMNLLKGQTFDEKFVQNFLSALWEKVHQQSLEVKPFTFGYDGEVSEAVVTPTSTVTFQPNFVGKEEQEKFDEEDLSYVSNIQFDDEFDPILSGESEEFDDFDPSDADAVTAALG